MKNILALGILLGSFLLIGCSSKNYYNTNSNGSTKQDSCKEIRNKLFSIRNSKYKTPYSYKEIEKLRAGEIFCNNRDVNANKDYSTIETMNNELDSLHDRANALIQRGKDIHIGR